MIQYNLTVPDSIGPLARDNRGHHGIPGTGRQRKPVVWSLLPARRTYPRNPPRRSRSDHDCCIMNTVCWMLDRNPAPAMQATGDGPLSYPVGKIPRCQRGRLIHVKRTPGSEWQAGHLGHGRGCLEAGVGTKATDGGGRICNDPAEPAQFRPLKRKLRRGSSCSAPDVGAAGCRTVSSHPVHGWRAAGIRTGAGGHTAP